MLRSNVTSSFIQALEKLTSVGTLVPTVTADSAQAVPTALPTLQHQGLQFHPPSFHGCSHGLQLPVWSPWDRLGCPLLESHLTRSASCTRQCCLRRLRPAPVCKIASPAPPVRVKTLFKGLY